MCKLAYLEDSASGGLPLLLRRRFQLR